MRAWEDPDRGKEVSWVPPRPQPTVTRRRLGMELRRLREGKGLTIEQVAEQMKLAPSTISRFENAQVRIRRGDVRELLDLFDVGEHERDRLLTLAAEALQKSWWHRSYGDLPVPYADFESAAEACLLYHSLVIPGLLQTEAYARATLQALSPGLEPSNVEHRIEFRLERQEHFLKQGKPRLHVVLDEAAMRRPIGGPTVMYEQLAHIVNLSKLDNVELRALPFSAGAHAGLDGDFIIFEFGAYPDVAYLETTVSDIWFEKPEDVVRYKRLFESLSDQALPPEKTVALVSRIARGFREAKNKKSKEE